MQVGQVKKFRPFRASENTDLEAGQILCSSLIYKGNARLPLHSSCQEVR